MSAVFRWEQDSDGIVLITIDDPNAKVNTVNDAYVRDLGMTLDRLEAEVDRITGVIVRSGKSSFLAGGDLKKLVRIEEADKQDFIASINGRKALLRRLELLSKPVVAIINGPALGGGLELALACHHRIIIDDGRAVVGLPEVGLGLMPGAGGVVRTARRLGLEVALNELILSGRRMSPQEAQGLGIIDAIVTSGEDALDDAREWILQHPEWVSPYDDGPLDPAADYPLPPVLANPSKRIVAEVAVAAVRQDVESALALETSGFADLVVGAPAKGSIQTVFLDTTTLRSRARERASADGDAPVIHCHSPAAYERALASGWAKIVTLHGPEATRDATSGGFHVDADASYPRRAWIGNDQIGDGQRLFEYWEDGSHKMSEAVAVLARRGVLPLGLGTAPVSFSVMMQASFREAVNDVLRGGTPSAYVEAALTWAGIEPAAFIGGGEADASDLADAPVLVKDLAHGILDHVASEAQQFTVDGGLVRADELDVASVRFGGFPPWTGGACRWLNRHETVPCR